MQQPVIEHLPRIILGGFSFFGDPFHSHSGWTEANEIGRLWNRFLEFLSQSDMPSPTISYEIHLANHETYQTGEFEVFVGFEVHDLEKIPVELSIKILPEADYAIFTLSTAQMQSDDSIIDCWLSSTGHKQAFSFYALRYDARFKGLDQPEESMLDVLVSITRVNPNDTV